MGCVCVWVCFCKKLTFIFPRSAFVFEILKLKILKFLVCVLLVVILCSCCVLSFKVWVGGFPSCDWIKFQKQGGMLEDHEGGHGVDGSFGNLDSGRGEFSFMNYLSELEMQQLQTPSLASNDDLGLEQSDPSGVEQLDLQSQSLESDAVIARELACLDPRREIASHSPVDVSMAVQVASQSLGCLLQNPFGKLVCGLRFLGLQLHHLQIFYRMLSDVLS